ncbi:MAG: hypothetical protein FWF65_09545, partial [Bacteroidetes bacterium]|nr:hypothetical protein [Bacteroidota bacterium]
VGYVAVPFSGGAMEHATNIAYPRSSISGTTANQNLISHELAHSWFGNLITCSTSQNMWINEGFATYGEYLCKEILDPTLATYCATIWAMISFSLLLLNFLMKINTEMLIPKSFYKNYPLFPE